MKTILVTTDFSAAASNAVHYAADMAISINAKLLMLHVVQTPIGYSDLPVLITLEDTMRTNEEQLQQLKNELQLQKGPKLIIETEVGMGSVYSELKMVCERVNPYAVIMGSQGHTAAEHLVFGSHAVHATQHLTWPLITVPPSATYHAVKKIGLASDLTKVVETTPIEEIKTLVQEFHAELHILNTGAKEVPNGEIIFQSALMEEMTMSLHPQFHFINDDNIERGILNFVDRNGIDLLVIMPRKHSLLDKLIHRSHTRELVLRSHIPVLALHSEEQHKN